jgi:hypothetical protein
MDLKDLVDHSDEAVSAVDDDLVAAVVVVVVIVNLGETGKHNKYCSVSSVRRSKRCIEKRGDRKLPHQHKRVASSTNVITMQLTRLKAARYPSHNQRRLPTRLLSNHLLLSKPTLDSTTVSDVPLDSIPIKPASIAAQAPLRPLFPWRHSVDPLERLVPHTRAHLTDICLPLVAQNVIAWDLLKESLWRSFVTGAYRKDLALSAAYAWTRGVQSVVTNVYNAHSKQDDSDDTLIDFTFPNESTTASENNKEQSAQTDTTSRMLSPALVDLYKSAHESGRHQVEICLQSTPVNASLYSLFAIPFVSRGVLQGQPQMVSQVNRFLKDFVRLTRGGPVPPQQLFNDYAHWVRDQQERNGKVVTTVEAQVVLTCVELFHVRDKATGEIIQGRLGEPTPNIQHLVRLEVDVTTTQGSRWPEHEMGQWQIVDWDDLVEEEVWYKEVFKE